MKKGKCPSCGSKNVYKKANGVQFLSGGGFYVNTLGSSNKNQKYDSYMCEDCGLFENHVTDEKTLAEVGENWEKVA